VLTRIRVCDLILDPCTPASMKMCRCNNAGLGGRPHEGPLCLIAAMTHCPVSTVANHAPLPTGSPSPSRRTLAPTALSVTHSSISRLPVRLSVPLLSSPARRSSSARSQSSLLASRSPTRSPRLPPLRAALTVLVAVSPLVVAAGLAVAAAGGPAVVVAVV
jgi:hypothetical protein